MQCLTKLHAELDELIELFMLHDIMRQAFPRYNHVLSKDPASQHWATDTELEKVTAKISSRPETDNRALYILAWGSFEQFVRGYINDSAKLRNELKIPAPKESQVWSQHAIVCSGLLADHIRGSKMLNMNIDVLAKDIHLGVVANAPWTLNADALSAVGGNMNEEMLELYGKRIGVNLEWQAIGAGTSVKKACSEDPDGAGSPGDWAKTKFCYIRDRRNTYAHQGVGNGGCDSNDLFKAIKYLRLLADRLVERAHEDLKS